MPGEIAVQLMTARPMETAMLRPTSLSYLSFMRPYGSCYFNEPIKNYEDSHSPSTEKPSLRKRVSFADSVGLALEHVRHITAGRDTPPDLSAHVFASLNLDDHQPKFPNLQLCFLQPVSDYSRFRQSLEQRNVSLESVSINGNQIIGTVKVKNLAFDKTVLTRLTYNGWITSEDVSAYYVNNGMINAQGNQIASAIDTFSFTHDLSGEKLKQNSGVQFAVCFRCAGQEFWDNNNGKNYCIEADSAPGSPVSQSTTSASPAADQNCNWTQFAIWRDLESDYTPYW